MQWIVSKWKCWAWKRNKLITPARLQRYFIESYCIVGNSRYFKMAAGTVLNFRSFLTGSITARKTFLVVRTGIRSSVPCVAIASRQFSETNSPVEEVTDSEKSPTVSRSPLFSGNKVTPKRFQLSFDEYQKRRRKLRTLQRLAGLPFGVTGLLASSCACAYLFPNMFDATPEQIQPIL